MKTFFIILIIFFFKLHYKDNICNKEWLKSYGLKGYKTYKRNINYQCPKIKNNCCNYKDQVEMYFKFVLRNEKENIENFYDDYFEAFKNINDTYKLLEFYINYKLKNVRLANSSINCRLMARKIKNLNLNYIMLQVLKNLDDQIKFFKEIKSAFYCMLCDYDTHKYFLNEDKIIKLSRKFCSKILKISIHHLNFKHIFFPKISFLISNFLFKCNSRMLYRPDKYVKKKYYFKGHSYFKIMIEKCLYNKQEPNWFFHCKNICTYFNWDKFSEFFFGEISKIKSYEKRLKIKLNYLIDPIFDISNIWNKVPIFQDIYKLENKKLNEQKFRNQRILTLVHKKEKTKSEDVKEFNYKYTYSWILPIRYKYRFDYKIKNNFNYDIAIFKKGYDYKVDLFDFDYKFGTKGINLVKYFGSEKINKRNAEYANIKIRDLKKIKKPKNKKKSKKISVLKLNGLKKFNNKIKIYLSLIFLFFI